MPFFYMDYWYLILVVPALLVSIWAQFRVKSTFSKYSSLAVRCGLTGRQTSEYMQRGGGIAVEVERGGGIAVEVEPVAGSMTDHFDPRTNVIRLSEPVYDRCSVAAVGVAAHETGHALQHAEGYAPVKWRTALVPVTNFSARLSPLLVVLGIVLSYDILAYAGIALFSVAVLFQLVTLPVEFNASRRALAALEGSGQFSDEELRGIRKVLSAAALTYVAAMLVSLMSLLRLILLVNGRSRRR
ncbi:MAG: zinc metallopeptidase [Clostridia bacterium]|nr:zinc metallopeptidase [Clostridia bacterium]